MKVLLDTNIVLEHFDQEILLDNSSFQFELSVISVTELLRLPGLSEDEQIRIQRFLRLTRIHPVDLQIAKQAAVLGRSRSLKLPDLFIAATAIEHRIPLITKDKQFSRIPSLDVRTRI